MKNCREEKLWKRIKRRFKSSRAAAFMEFAFVAPILVMVISAMLEFTQLWDAKIMANHTAWTLGRIATVRGTGEWTVNSKIAGKVSIIDDFNDARAVTTILLMSTCVMGSWGDFVQDAEDFLFEKIVAPIMDLTHNIKDKQSEYNTTINNFKIPGLNMPVPDKVKALIQPLVDKLNGLANTVTDKLLSPLSLKLYMLIHTLCETLLRDLNDLVLYDAPRSVRQIIYASRRWEKCKDIVSLVELKGEPYEFTKNNTALTQKNNMSLSYPRCLDSYSKFDDDLGFVIQDSSWPSESTCERMIKVKVSWPFERAWLFPVVSGIYKSGAKSGAVRAVGHSLVYQQPNITLKHLLSKGAAAYNNVVNTNKLADCIKEIQREVMGLGKLAVFGLNYRLEQEQINFYDSSKTAKGSYKGIGLGSSADGAKYTNTDGLVFWMGRAPADPTVQDDWNRDDLKKWDYMQCWKALAGDRDETPYYYTGSIQEHFDTPNWYHPKDWFYWGTPSTCPEVHLRYRFDCKWAETASQFQQWESDKKEYDRPPFSEGKKPWAGKKDSVPNYYFKQCFGDTVDGYLTEKQYDHWTSEIKSKVWNSSLKKVKAISYDDYLIVNKCGNGLLRMSMNTRYYHWDSANHKANVDAENELLKKIGEARTAVNNLRELLEKEIKELSGGTSGSSTDYSTVNLDSIDWGVNETEIMKDPTKAEGIIRKKLEGIKADNFKLLKKIDDQIKVATAAESAARSTVESVCINRYKELARTQALMGFVLNIDPKIVASNATEGAVIDRINAFTPQYTLTSATNDRAAMLAAVNTLTNEIENCRQCEIAYGNFFNSSAAKDESKKSIDDIVSDDGKKPEDPIVPPGSSPSSGSDDDWGGDSWRYDSNKRKWVRQ